MFFLLLLFFIQLKRSADADDVFPKKTFITVTPIGGSDIFDVDVPLIVDTKTLIDQSMIVNCSYLRFGVGGDLVDFFVETPCNTVNTKIWLKFGRLNSSSMNISMYYGVTDFSLIPNDGAELIWDSQFLVLSNGSCGDWEDINVDKKRFLSLGSSYGTVDSFYNIENHHHQLQGRTSASDNMTKVNTGLCWVSTNSDLSLGEHHHTFNITSTYNETMPPYQTIRMCGNRHLVLEKGLILAYNDSDFSKVGIERYLDLDEKCVVIWDNSTGSGGNMYHEHTQSGTLTGTFFVQVGFQYDSAVLEYQYFSDATHVHNYDMVFDKISNLPKSFGIPFIYTAKNLSSTETMNLKFHLFGKSLPPLGYEKSGLDSYFIRGRSTYGDFVSGTPTNHSVTGNIQQSSLFGWNCHNPPSTPPYIANDMHSHSMDPSRYSMKLIEGGRHDPNDRDRIEVVGFYQKPIITTQVVGYEKINRQCYFFDYDDPNACSGHGECVGNDQCVCNSTLTNVYSGFKCQYWTCNQVSNQDLEDVCYGHGQCIDSDVCICDYNYNGSFCAWTCLGIDWNDITKQDVICSGHGSCFSIDMCNCTAGNYSGNLCQEWYCYDIKNTEIGKVCNGQGTCTDYDYCSCGYGFVGKNCKGKIGVCYFSKDGGTIELEYESEIQFFTSQEIPDESGMSKYFHCSTRVENHEVLGTDPYCYFSLNEDMNMTEKLTILLGQNPTLTTSTYLKIKDSAMNSYSREVKYPDYPTVPKVSLKDDVSYCVTNKTYLDTYSDNIRDLNFYWTINEYSTGELYTTSNEQFYKLTSYGDMVPNSRYVVYVQASNFMGGYGVDYLLCKVPPLNFDKASVFEEGSTYGYTVFSIFFFLSFLLLFISCFVCFFCFCWNFIQLDIVKDRLYGIQLLIDDLGIARKKQKLRMYRMTMMQVDTDDIFDDEEWDEYESELKDFARRSVKVVLPESPSSSTQLLKDGPEVIPASPATPSSTTKLMLDQEKEDDFNVIKDLEIEDEKEKSVSSVIQSPAKSGKSESSSDSSDGESSSSESSTPEKKVKKLPPRIPTGFGSPKSLPKKPTTKEITPPKKLPPKAPPKKLPKKAPPKKLPPKAPPKKIPPNAPPKKDPKILPQKAPPKKVPPRVPPPRRIPSSPTSPLPKKKPKTPVEKRKINLFENDDSDDEEEDKQKSWGSFVNQFNDY